jgi:ribosomal protein L11 methyltransferase
MNTQWIRIEVSIGQELADELASEMAEFFEIGVEIIGTGICFYLPEGCFFGQGQEAIDQILGDFKRSRNLDTSPLYSFSSFADEDWLAEWKRDFKPLRVRKHLVIAPTWEQFAPNPRDRVVRIDPGQAFGTGHHETTRLCLEWLEERAEARPDRRSGSLLDVGAGSGILAIAGVLLGFDRVHAVDNDPEAIAVVRENLVLNGVAENIAVHLGTAADIHDFYDVVIANIQALPLIDMANGLAQRMNPSGVLVLSGILVEQRDAVQAAFEREGLKLRRTEVAGEWCLMEFEGSSEGRGLMGVGSKDLCC